MNTEYDFSAATDAARCKVHKALDTARQRTEDAVARGGQCVRERPAATLLSVFAAGIAVGAIVALATRPTPPKSTLASSLEDSRDHLAEIFGTVAANLRAPLERTRASLTDNASLLSDSVGRAMEKVRVGTKLRWW